MRKTVLAVFAFTMMLLFVFGTIVYVGTPQVENALTAPGHADLRDMNFSNRVGRANSWLHFPEHLLVPENMSTATPAEDGVESTFGSYALDVMVPANNSVTLAFISPIFSTKVFINGVEIEEIGVVSASDTLFEPHRKYCFYNVMPENGKISMVLQYSNFYTNYSVAPTIYVGRIDRMFSWQARSDFMQFSLTYLYLITFLLFFGIFLFNYKHRENLYFSLTCLLLATRESLIGEEFIYLFFPNADEKIMFVIQYVSIGVLAILLFSLVISIFPEIIGKKRKFWFYVACSLFLVTALISKAEMTPPSTIAFLLIGCGIMVNILVGLVVSVKTYEISRLFSAIGVVLLFSASLNDMFHHFHVTIGLIGRYALTQKTIAVFIIIQVIALFMRFMQIEQTLSKALQYEKQLLEQNQMLQIINQKRLEFFSNISHEMKTPLTVVSNYAQLTRRHEEKKNIPDTYTSEKMVLITSEAKRMALMVEELIDIAKIDEGGMKWEFSDVDFAKLVGEAVEKYYPVLNKNHNNLVVSLPDNLPIIKADAKRIEQVLINLIANAIKFTNRGTITIGGAATEDTLQMIISDTGRGISEEESKHLFERYYTSETEKGLFKGTGLGLIVSNEIILAHGGNIAIDSVLGKGTTVTVSLPLVLDANKEKPHE